VIAKFILRVVFIEGGIDMFELLTLAKKEHAGEWLI